MKSLAALDRPSWLSSSAWPWQPYLLSHHQGGIAVTDIGDGPAVLFVHVGSWSFVWRDVLLRLANDFRCVAIDAPGCGLSDRLSTPPTLAQAADAITSVIDALQLRDLTLVAHDLGGRQGVWAPARQAHHGHLVDAERVGDGPQIVGERQDGFVLMRRRGADAGPIDANQTNIVVLGVDPGFGRDLPPGPWGAMQPEDRTTLRGAELGEADPAVLADGDVSFQFRTGNSDGHGE